MNNYVSNAFSTPLSSGFLHQQKKYKQRSKQTIINKKTTETKQNINSKQKKKKKKIKQQTSQKE
jgi:hypothetical protein